MASFHPHYLTFTLQTYHHPERRFRSRSEDITITSTHRSTSAAKKYIQPYIHKVFACTKQNNLILNPDKTTSTLFTPEHAEYTSNQDLKINNNTLPMATLLCIFKHFGYVWEVCSGFNPSHTAPPYMCDCPPSYCATTYSIQKTL